MSNLLKEQAVAEIMGISVHKLRRDRTYGGGIPFVKMAGAIRYRQEDIENYIASKVRKSTSDPGPRKAA